MRLDHLLSRERIQREIGGFIPGRYRHTKVSLWSTKVLKAEEAKNPRSETQSGRMTVYFLTLYRFQGSRERNLICTLKTAQPDGKTSCKETSCECVQKNARAQKCEQFCSWSQEKKQTQSKNFDSYSVTIKLLRAQGGCHGTGRRRKTW